MVSKLWIDDIRKAENFLGKDAEGVVSMSEARSARKYLVDNAETIEVLYLDNFLGHQTITGENIMEKIRYRLQFFKKLKTIYLHSSDNSVVARILERHKEHFKEHGVDVVDAPYREND